MTTKFKVTATAPTIYQYSSLTRFGLKIKENGNGSFTGEMLFDDHEDAKKHLIDRATYYYDEFEGQIDEHLEDIENYGMLTIDAVTARIEEVEVPSGKFVLLFDSGHRGNRYISCEDDKDGCTLPENAMEFDTEEEARAYNDKHGYACCVEII